MPPTLTILPWSPDLATAFHDINAQWIEAMFALEETDRLVLQNPRRLIIDKGGDILFVAVEGLGVVGACALMPSKDTGVFELTKMGVLDSARGLKAGEHLLAAVLRRAQELEIETLFLLTNKKCEAAIHLYEKLGFIHDAGIMATYGARYERCDVAMLYKESIAQNETISVI
jgi:N-acetylglutamate synthase-like GNAT family acetyltransferase